MAKELSDYEKEKEVMIKDMSDLGVFIVPDD